MATIYRKTAKGHTEIETRAIKLAPRFRSLLILVDGRRSDDELMQLLPQAGANAIEALALGGFIEAIGVTADVSSPRAAPAAANPPSPRPSFEQRRTEAVRALTHLVGPAAAPMTQNMARTRNADELRPLLASAAQLVANTHGQAAAAAFAQHFIND